MPLSRFTLCALLALAGCGDDGGVPDADVGCSSDAECSDALYCNGEERCDPSAAAADARGCVPGDDPCPAGSCDETADRCLDCSLTTDADGDGADAIACGGDDCDDTNAAVNPSATEICDAEGVDEDCDPTTFGGLDADEDGFVSAACCNGESCGDDCDDAAAGVHPTEAEECDGVDQDCDGTVDEGVLATFTEDADGDGHATDAAGAATTEACEPPAGFARATDDCDDTNGAIHPGAFDRCDEAMVDDDCSGTPNDPPGGCECTSGSTRTCPFPGACAASTQLCTSGVWGGCGIGATDEICANDIDEDCDGAADDGCTCDEEFRVCGSDVGACVRGVQRCTLEGWGPCVDEVPAAPETCNEIDDDCDGATDEGLTRTCWADGDGDGFAATAATVIQSCDASCPAGTTGLEPVGTDADCDDADAAAFPGQTLFFARERIGVPGFDFDCDGEEITNSPGEGCPTEPGGGCRHELYWTTDTYYCGRQAETYVCVEDTDGSCLDPNGITCDFSGMNCPVVRCR